MAKEDSAAHQLTPVLREDGTIYFDYVNEPRSELLYELALAFLWFLVPVVLAGLVIWY